MNKHALRRLMGTVDLQKPSKDILWEFLYRELLRVHPTTCEANTIRTAFEISYAGHENAPPRQSGEAYIFHPVRAAIRAIEHQVRLGMRDIKLVAQILLHDCFEDAEKAGISPLIMRSNVLLRMGDEITYDVHCLTKHADESNAEYMERLTRSDRWRPLAGKMYDRKDNIDTIDSLPRDKQIKKIVETRDWFYGIAERLRFLIERDIEAKRLNEAFRMLPILTYRELVILVDREMKRLQIH